MLLKALLAACLFSVFATSASAVLLLPPCFRPAGVVFSPSNPGPTDPVAIWVTVNVYPPGFTPDQWFLLSASARVGPRDSSTILVDLIYTTDPTRYPTYRVVDVYGDAPVGTIGPFAPGNYTVNITLNYFDATTATVVPVCTDHPNVQSSFTVAAQPGPTEVVNIIEFYNANLNHYFMTEDPREIIDLDTGVHPGWVRTGLSFRAYAPLHGDDNRGRGVARYYGLPSAGLDSHFYTWSIRETAGMRDKGLLDVWKIEGFPVFEIPTPDTATGTCQTGTLPVYRLWNQRADSNHRYTTDPAIKQQMINLGWTPEGYGPDAVFMCALNPTTLSITKSQSTSGTTLLNLSGTDSSVCVVFDATSSAITSNIISIHTLYHMNGCIGEAPRGVVNITTDVGFLAAGHYTVTWETDGQQARTEFDVP